MTLGIFGFGPVVELPPLPPLAPKELPHEPPRAVETRACVTCGKAFRPRWKAIKRRGPFACSRSCSTRHVGALTYAASRAAVLGALTSDGRTTIDVAAAAGVSRVATAYHLRALALDGLVTRRRVVRVDALGRPRSSAGWTLSRTEAAE